jgi:predicted RecA/RadA family phage recombinase
MAANSFEAKRVKDGSLCYDYTPSGALSAGDVVVDGNLFGIAEVDIAASAVGSLAADGVFDMAKASSVVTFAIGDIVAWDVSENLTIAVADVAAGDKTFGKVVKAAVATDTTVRVLVIPDNSAVTAGS